MSLAKFTMGGVTFNSSSTTSEPIECKLLIIRIKSKSNQPIGREL